MTHGLGYRTSIDPSSHLCWEHRKNVFELQENETESHRFLYKVSSIKTSCLSLNVVSHPLDSAGRWRL